MKLSEVKALVTGGSSGIGYEIAHQLRQAGAAVTISGRNAENLSKAAMELDVHKVQADVSVEADAIRSIEMAQKFMGGLNVLINNAAYGIFAPLVETDVTIFDQLMATNVRGAMLMAREAAKVFIAQNHGNIINISSTAGLSGFAAGTAYVASKFALKGMTECWRSELRKHNIRVMLINPSEVQTNFYLNSGRDQRGFNPTKLEAEEIAHVALSMLEMRNVGFITEATVFATNPQ